ncbi:MAG: hypothetical protein ACRDZQ_12985 [Acidimicrobiales bacterium]
MATARATIYLPVWLHQRARAELPAEETVSGGVAAAALLRCLDELEAERAERADPPATD